MEPGFVIIVLAIIFMAAFGYVVSRVRDEIQRQREYVASLERELRELKHQRVWH